MIKKRLKTVVKINLHQWNVTVILIKKCSYYRRVFSVAQKDRKIKLPSSPIRLFPRRCFPPSCDSRSRYRWTKRYFSRRTYLLKRRCEMNKAFYLFQRKIFSSRPLNTAREKKTLALFCLFTALVKVTTMKDMMRRLEERTKIGFDLHRSMTSLSSEILWGAFPEIWSSARLIQSFAAFPNVRGW